MDESSATGWAAAAAIADRQHGRISTEQLHASGVSRTSIDKACASGRLFREHTGVFALGHRAPTRPADWMAAVLACGAGTVLSVRSGATCWTFRDGETARIDVTNATGSGRTRAGIRVHRALLLPGEMTECKGIPITSPSRTMVDLAHELDDRDDIEWAFRELQFKRLFDPEALAISLARRPHALLAELLEDVAPTRSRLEVAFLNRVIRAFGVPRPQSQKRIGGRVDFYWPQARLVVEVDGGGHRQPWMQAEDARRDNRLQLGGYMVLRYVARDIYRTPERTAAQILQALAARSPLG